MAGNALRLVISMSAAVIPSGWCARTLETNVNELEKVTNPLTRPDESGHPLPRGEGGPQGPGEGSVLRLILRRWPVLYTADSAMFDEVAGVQFGDCLA